MEKRDAAFALENELFQIYSMADRVRCMIDDVMELYFICHGLFNEREQFKRACIRLEVAQEAIDETCSALDALLT